MTCSQISSALSLLKPVNKEIGFRTSTPWLSSVHLRHGIWEQVMAKGQDACCCRCQYALSKASGRKEIHLPYVGCDQCHQMRAPEMFTEDGILAWTSETSKTPIICKPCQGMKATTSTDAVEMIRCHGLGCERPIPVYNFIERHLLEWRKKGTLDQEALCARCHLCVHDEKSAEREVKCKNCDTTKPLKAFTAVAIKSYLAGPRTKNIRP